MRERVYEHERIHGHGSELHVHGEQREYMVLHVHEELRVQLERHVQLGQHERLVLGGLLALDVLLEPDELLVLEHASQ